MRAKGEGEFAGEDGFGTDMQKRGVTAGFEIKIIEFLPEIEMIFNANAFATESVSKVGGRSAIEGKGHENKRDDNQYKRVLGEEEEYDYNEQGDENGGGKKLFGFSLKGSAWCTPFQIGSNSCGWFGGRGWLRRGGLMSGFGLLFGGVFFVVWHTITVTQKIGEYKSE